MPRTPACRPIALRAIERARRAGSQSPEPRPDSAMRRDLALSPLLWLGSTAMRSSGASVGSLVNAQIVIGSVASNLSSCTITTERGCRRGPSRRLGPHLTAPHSSPSAGRASTNARSSAVCGLDVTRRDCRDASAAKRGDRVSGTQILNRAQALCTETLAVRADLLARAGGLRVPGLGCLRTDGTWPSTWRCCGPCEKRARRTRRRARRLLHAGEPAGRAISSMSLLRRRQPRRDEQRRRHRTPG